MTKDDILAELVNFKEELERTVSDLEKDYKRSRNNWDRGWKGGAKSAYEAAAIRLNGILQAANND